MKRFLNLLVVSSLVAGLGFFGHGVKAAETVSSSTDEIKVVVEGKEVEFPDAKPYLDLKTGRTMVPVRFVSEALQANVKWDGTKNMVTMERQGTKIYLVVGENTVDIDDRTVRLDAPSVLKDWRTFVPLRFVSETFDQKVDWDADNKIVTITPLPDEDIPFRPTIKLMPVDPLAQPAMELVAKKARIEGNVFITEMPKIPDGYSVNFNYKDQSDGVYGVREYDIKQIEKKYKAGETVRIPFYGKGGYVSFSMFKGVQGVGGVSIDVPSLDTYWLNERHK
ncbi:copper amine oxidase N-terminal domain-containing protein [Brevibacillus massiliensis]|uniref:copper amine oxidase N-terminal domain-containing protein n=1 Tax=Brevibacillus massiliensis TaxID=1118054 RepID=UPI0002DD57FF|nr:copper amine oxidase N-terminal domain-containing protein [Brevibacillus massiliensis]